MRRLAGFAVLLPWLVLVVSGVDAQDQPAFGAPLSSKIWDDFSLRNVSSKAHKALGYATVTLGAAAILWGHAEPGSAAHRFLGESAAVGAGATLVSGFVAHFDQLAFSGDLLTWNNLHALTGITGAVLMDSAALVAPSSEIHSSLGILGTALMALAIVLEG